MHEDLSKQLPSQYVAHILLSPGLPKSIIQALYDHKGLSSQRKTQMKLEPQKTVKGSGRENHYTNIVAKSMIKVVNMKIEAIFVF